MSGVRFFMRCIDAHHHLWRYSAAEYGWISDSMEELRRDFLPGDLEAEAKSAHIDAAIAVQARQTMQETYWLLELARENPFMAGVVGWASIISPEFPKLLGELCVHPKLKGLRHVLQDESDDGYALRGEFQRGIHALAGTGLVYDILIYERHLPAAVPLVDRNPNQIFVLDHLAKPKIAMQEISPWRENLRELARRPNVNCKVSGLVTEANWEAWTVRDLEPYLEIALECFGPERLLAGSDWPVCLLATRYQRWWETLRQWVSKLSDFEQGNILGGNAVRVYRLEGESA
jgi:L-fuconolactonase